METFVVRVWRPAEGQGAGGAPDDLRGIVLHPSSGIETPFSSEAELLKALRRPPAGGAGAGPC
jgi:hypothetical protein